MSARKPRASVIGDARDETWFASVAWTPAALVPLGAEALRVHLRGRSPLAQCFPAAIRPHMDEALRVAADQARALADGEPAAWQRLALRLQWLDGWRRSYAGPAYGLRKGEAADTRQLASDHVWSPEGFPRLAPGAERRHRLLILPGKPE